MFIGNLRNILLELSYRFFSKSKGRISDELCVPFNEQDFMADNLWVFHRYIWCLLYLKNYTHIPFQPLLVATMTHICHILIII